MQVTSMKVGDLFPRPRLRLQADGVGVDLSEAVSVTARVRLPGSTSHVDRDVTVADQDVTANHGIVTVVLIDGDTDFQGTIKFDIEVEWATGVQTWPSRGYFKIWLLEDADSAQGGGPPLVGSSGDPFTLDRIYDVNISSVADNDLLQYDSTSARWLNVAPADVRSTLGLGSAALSSTTDFIRSSVTQAGAALTPTAQTLWSFQPADTNRGPFQWVMGGAAFDSVFDPVMYLGYNVTDGGGVAKSGEASFRTALESHYRNGGVNNFEYYFEYMSGDLVTRRRPFFLQMDKSTGAVNSMQFSANTAYFTQESDEAPYFTISRGNITSAPYAGTPIEWRIKAASAQNSVFTMENSTSVALTVETLSANSAVLRAGSIANENLYLFNNRGIAVNVQDNAAALTVMGGAVGPVAVFRAGSVAGNLTTWQDNASSVLASVSAAGLATFAGVTLTDATNLVFGTSTGTKIGTATSQKLGFFNATPVIQQTGNALDALEALGLVASATLAVADITGLGTMATATASDYLSKAGNLSGIADLAVARTNLGLGTMATESASAYAALAGATFTGASMIDGTANAVQLRVQGHSTQAANLQTWENSAGSVLMRVNADGEFCGTYISDLAQSAPFITMSGDRILLRNRTTVSNVTLDVRGMAGQTGDLQQWRNSSSTVLAYVSALGGSVFATTAIGTTNQYGAVSSINTVANGNLGLAIRAAGPSQTADLQQWQNSSSTVLASVSAAGKGFFADVATSSSGAGSLFTQYVQYGASTGPYIQLTSTGGTVAVRSRATNEIPLTVNGVTSQSALLQSWQVNAAEVASISAAGVGAFTGATFTGNVSITGGSLLAQNVTALTNLGPYWTFDGTNAYSTARGPAQIPFVARLSGAHTANAIEVRNSSSTVLASISAAGAGTFSGTVSTTSGFSVSPVAKPASAPTLALLGVAGNVTTGTHYYFVAYVAPNGETELSAVSASITTDTATAGQVTVTIPVSPDSRVTARNIYRTTAGGAYWSTALLLTTVADNTTTTYLDNVADGSLTGSNSYYRDNLTVKALSSDSTVTFFPGQKNTFAGLSAGGGITAGGGTGGDNTAFGVGALRYITSGSGNAMVGTQAGLSITSGVDNVGMGNGPLASLTSGSNNISFGRNASTYNRTGGSNVTIGGYAGTGASTVSDYAAATVVGYFAGNALRSAGSYNTLIGYYAGALVTTGANNVFIGNTAGRYTTTESNEIQINSIDRTNRAGDIAGSIIYGVQNATAASQTLTLNAAVTAVYGLSVGDGYNFIIGTTTGSKIGQASSKIGFFNATPVAKPTGVAVDAASIHAALVSLGLISA